LSGLRLPDPFCHPHFNGRVIGMVHLFDTIQQQAAAPESSNCLLMLGTQPFQTF
jgi:hypothetical protein